MAFTSPGNRSSRSVVVLAWTQPLVLLTRRLK
jgi:hypothetical protein